jgi:hypothetical protein
MSHLLRRSLTFSGHKTENFREKRLLGPANDQDPINLSLMATYHCYYV